VSSRVAIAAALGAAALTACSAPTTGGRGSPDPGQLPARTAQLPAPTESGAPSPTPVPTTPAPTPAPTTTPARACPAAVAATLPGGAGATLVAGFETRRFRIHYCRTTGGALYYHGASRTAAAQQVTIPATPIAGGFQASRVVAGHTFVYRVTTRLTVTEDGRTLLTDPVTARL
jgi:hypothetical protein